MSVAPNSGIVDFSTFSPPSGGQDGIQGQVPKPLAGQGNYVLTGNGWVALSSLGTLIYKGTWDAATNTPTLQSSVGTQGDYYVVSVAGNTDLNGTTTWTVGDWVVFNGSVWQKIEGGSTVDITGGQINNTTIGNVVPAAGTFSTLTTPSATITGGSINGTAIGATTPAAGSFTTGAFTSVQVGSTPIEIVTNGQFTSNVTGWTGSGATLSWNSGAMRVTSTSPSGVSGYQAISVVAGRVYKISGAATYVSGSITVIQVALRDSTSAATSGLIAGWTYSGPFVAGTTYSGDVLFTATTTGTVWVHCRVFVSSGTAVVDYDFASVTDGQETNIGPFQTTVPAGSASTPPYSVNVDTNTGMFFPAADTIAFAEGGAEAMRIDSNGNVGIGTSTPASDARLTISNGGTSDVSLMFNRSGTGQFDAAITNSVGNLIFRNGTDSSTVAGIPERMRITDSGQVLIGQSTSFDTNSLVQVSKNGINSFIVYSAGAGSLDRGLFNAFKSRGTVGSPSAVVSEDRLGSLSFSGYDGSNYVSGGLVDAFVDGTVTSGSVPTRISFVTGSNAGNRQERLTIKNDGKVGIGVTSPTQALDVNGDVVAKNIFNPFLLAGM